MLDHLRRDADGDLLRRLGQDGKADGRVNAVDLRLGKAVAAQTLARLGDLAAAADAADIGRVASEHLREDLIIRLMARRHHNGIVVRRERYLAEDIGKAAEDDLVRRGSLFLILVR